MAVGDVYRIQQFFNIGSEITENVIHFKETVSCDDDLPAESLAYNWHDMLQPLYAVDLFSDDAECSVMHCRRIAPTTGIPATVIFGGAELAVIAGAAEVNPVPSQAALLISLYSNLLDAHGRGRVYIPGVANDAQNDGKLLALRQVEANALAELFEQEITGTAGTTGTWRCCIWSRTNEVGTNVVSAQAHSNLATQKRRRNFPGLG